jgi:predicted unusual protein kinase regulating ubiquinone biosynthesis (AarF/ABC1/UbiB family)
MNVSVGGSLGRISKLAGPLGRMSGAGALQRLGDTVARAPVAAAKAARALPLATGATAVTDSVRAGISRLRWAGAEDALAVAGRHSRAALAKLGEAAMATPPAVLGAVRAVPVGAAARAVTDVVRGGASRLRWTPAEDALALAGRHSRAALAKLADAASALGARGPRPMGPGANPGGADGAAPMIDKIRDALAAVPGLVLNAVRYGLLPTVPGVVTTALREGVSQLHWKTVGDALVRVAQHSGPVLTKLGQVLATRNDVLPDAACERLQALYARQPPMTDTELSQLLKVAFPAGLPFTTFERTPIAVGSIGQVHRACLPGAPDGLPVVVKLLRPGIERAIERDLNAATLVWDIAQRLRRSNGTRSEEAIARALRDLGEAMRAEVDLQREAAALEEFGRRFRANPRIRVPVVYRALCSAHALVMEELSGEPLSAFRARARHDPEAARKVAALAVQEILAQIFDEGRFHADPHAGNLLILPDGRLGLVDLGLVGEAFPEDRKRIARAVRAFVSGDPDVLTRTLLEFGSLPPDFDYPAFRADVCAAVRGSEAVFARVTGKEAHENEGSGAENSLEQLVNKLFRVAYAHGVYVPRSTTLLIKTLVTIEGVARSLDPSINLVTTAIPIVLKSLTPRWLRWRFW